MFTTASAWGTCVDIGQQHSAVVGATMNSAGAFGSMIGPLVVAYSVQKFNNWDVPLYLLSGMFIFGAICWLFIDPLKPIFDPERPNSGSHGV
jgi:MFS family permease